MSKPVYVSLPVADLAKSIAFFQALGFSLNPQMSSEAGACVVVSESFFVMLLTHAFWRQRTPKAICDTSQAAEMAICLTCDSRKQVDDLIAAAVAAGGAIDGPPDDFDFMYQQGFTDPDGHAWAFMHAGVMTQ